MHEDGDVNIKAHANMEHEGDACELFNGEGDINIRYSYDLNQVFAHSNSRRMAHARRIVMWCCSISVELTLKSWWSLPKIKA